MTIRISKILHINLVAAGILCCGNYQVILIFGHASTNIAVRLFFSAINQLVCGLRCSQYMVIQVVMLGFGGKLTGLLGIIITTVIEASATAPGYTTKFDIDQCVIYYFPSLGINNHNFSPVGPTFSNQKGG